MKCTGLRWCSWILPLFWLLMGAARSQETAPQPLSIAEQFALASDRKALLAQLIPGSQEYYYYSCLERQHAGDLEGARSLLEDWIERHGNGERSRIIQTRQALLSYTKDPAGTWGWLRRELELRFDAQRVVPGAKPDLPTTLDPALVTEAAWLGRELERAKQGQAPSDQVALARCLAEPLEDKVFAQLLMRLQDADAPATLDWILRGLKLDSIKGFGSLPVSRALHLAQFEELARRQPGLLADRVFVSAWIQRLAPSADEASSSSRASRLAHLERLDALAQRLSPAFNSFKAEVIFNRLLLDQELGQPNLARFQAYLRFPRESTWMRSERIEKLRNSAEWTQATDRFPTGLASWQQDAELVRSYLEHFLRDAQDTQAFEEWIDSEYLTRVFAETKILAGVGDMERWYTLLDDPAAYEELQKRVELRFAPTQTEWFEADAAVSIDLVTKNVPTLLVKIYEIHALNYYTSTQTEIPAALALDGLVPNEEQTFRYEDHPLRRVARRFEFARLSQPGTYVVEFIGNGHASRVLVRKGRLHFQERLSSAGHALRVVDERGTWHKDAVLYLQGHRFTCNERGEVLVPYSSEPGTRSVVLEAGQRVSLAKLVHRAEEYRAELSAWVNRENLHSGSKAKLLLQANLRIGEALASPKLVENSRLTLVSTDQDGVRSRLDVAQPQWSENREYELEFSVPARLRELSVEWTGQVRLAANGQLVVIQAQSTPMVLSEILPTSISSSPLLGQTPEGWHIDWLGRNGEALAERPLTLKLQHALYGAPLELQLKTDASGRIHLGPLVGVTHIVAVDFPGGARQWELVGPRASLPSVLHGAAGETLRIAYPQQVLRLNHEAFALLEMRDGLPFRDASAALAWTDGYLELRGLNAGNYELHLKQERRVVTVRVAAGSAQNGWISSAARTLEASEARPLAISQARHDSSGLELQFAGVSPSTRVHIFSTRYLPSFAPQQRFSPANVEPARWAELGGEPSEFLTGRELSDEFRYILERRYARKYAGNLLPRAGLVLNPWELTISWSDAERLNRGSAFGSRKGAGRAGGPSAGGPAGYGGGGVGLATNFPDLDFLAGEVALVTNASPDAQGVLRVPSDRLGTGQMLHILALDARTQIYYPLVRAETPRSVTDRRLLVGLAPEEHYAERRAVELVRPGATLRVDESSTEALQSYDSLDDVFQYYRARTANAELESFSFLLRWPQLSMEEKRALYSKYACHELHFFLYKKDPEFFQAIVRPYLTNKLELDFLDRWLLAQDLQDYLRPEAFRRLNIVERILLLQRLDNRAEDGARHVREAVDLVARNPSIEDAQFSTGLFGRSLDVDGAGGFALRTGAPVVGDAAPGAQTGGETGERFRDQVKNEAALEEASKDPGEAESKTKSAPEQDLKDRGRVERFAALVPTTKVFVESHYWHLPRSAQTADRIQANPFWLDFALWRAGEPFLSTHFLHTANTLSEMLLALAVLDLPFQAGQHEITREQSTQNLRARSPLLAIRRELRAGPATTPGAPLLLSQDCYRVDDRYEFAGAKRRDKFVRGEYLVSVAYGCRVVLTNPSSTARELELLTQIPTGSIALSGARATRGQRLVLGAYETKSVEFEFYFPNEGRFAMYPAHVAEEGAIVAFAAPQTLEVLREAVSVDTSSWEVISQTGSAEAVLTYLDAAHLERVDLSRIHWRMRDRSFYDALTARLGKRLHFDPNISAFSLLHEDETRAREYLAQATKILRYTGARLDSPLLRVDPIANLDFEQLEFDPLINARAHPIGQQRMILNQQLEQQYSKWISLLCYSPQLNSSDWLRTCYYMLLQERIEEALAAFAKVDPAQVPMRIQYDYMQAYLDFYSEEHALARGIAERYREYPVQHWRERFLQVLTQLDEAEGKAAAGGPDQSSSTAMAAKAPSLSAEWTGSQLEISYQNLSRCEISYFPMDIELLFSTNPFVGQDAGAFAFIQPRRRDAIDLPANSNVHSLVLPQELKSMNLLLEVRSGALVRRIPCLQGALRVQWLENLGQLAVRSRESGAPLAKVYVKVYAKQANGSVRFHKDGYTDLRGRFDYAAVSGEDAQDAVLYAVLVTSETEGAVIREVQPPVR